MNLPPLPEPADVIRFGTQLLRVFTATQMQAYALLAIKEYKASVSKRQSHRKYLDDKVAEVRDYATKGMNYKQVNKVVPMSEVTFINIVKHRGAYK